MLYHVAFAFTGDEAAESRNFETLYFAAVTTASMELAKLEGPYSTFEGLHLSGRISA
jgi:ribonucleoside-diphosphate reductase alpha chain